MRDAYKAYKAGEISATTYMAAQKNFTDSV